MTTIPTQLQATIAPKTLKAEFVSPASIRSALLQAARGRSIEVDAQALEQWVVEACSKAQRIGRLMTDQQLHDLHARRSLTVGDSAAYVAKTRDEIIAGGRRVVRPQGQRGKIVQATMVHGDHDLMHFVFDPDDGERIRLDAQLMFCGWPLLERVL